MKSLHRDHYAAILISLTDLLWISSWLVIIPLARGSAPNGLMAIYPTVFVIVQIFFLTLSGAYRLPRRWGFNEAVPAILRAAPPMILIILLSMGLLILNGQNDVIYLAKLLLLFLLLVMPGLVAIRLLTGRIELSLFRKGFFLRRAMVLGAGPGADYLIGRVEKSEWLGERIIHLAGQEEHSAESDRLAELVRGGQVDVVWLSCDIHDQTIDRLIPLIHSNQGRTVIWRILPEHRLSLTKRFSRQLTSADHRFLNKTLDQELSLAELSIAFVGSRGVPANYSGVERYVEEIGGHLAGLGERLVVYCHRRFISIRGSYKGMELRFVPTVPSKNFETIVHALLSTLHAMLREEEIIHYQALGPSTLAWLPRIFGRKVVVTVQGLDWKRAKWGPMARFYLRIGEWASAHFPHLTIVVSKTLFDYYQAKYPRTNVVYIPNGAIVPKHNQLVQINRLGLEKDNYILFVGRLEPEKGCHLLIEAYSKIRTDHHLVIAGKENHGTAYRRQLDTAAAYLQNVHFTGFVEGETLAALYSNAYVVVLPSDIEGMSLVLLEALSYGNCVLASDIRENKETVQEMGHTFERGNQHDLAEKLQFLSDYPKEIEEKRAKAREFSAMHKGWEEIAVATLQAYNQLVG